MHTQFLPLRLPTIRVPRLLFVPLCLLMLWRLPLSAQAQEAGPVPVGTQNAPVYDALASGDVYVDPSINGIDTSALQQAATGGRSPVKIAILSALPPAFIANFKSEEAQHPPLAATVGGRFRDAYTSDLHKALGLDKTPLILVSLQGTNPGVTVWTSALSADERNQLEQQYAQAIKTNPQAGTAQLAGAVSARIDSVGAGHSAALWLVFLAVVLGIGGLIWSAARSRKKQVAAAQEPVEFLRENVLSGIEYLDGYADVLPKNNPDSDQARTFRQAASARYEQAAKILDQARSMTDLNRAQTLLDQAQADVQSARRALDRATGGTQNIPGDDALRPPPLPSSQPQVEAIPAGQRGVSFFSGRPAPLPSLVPVTLTLGGESRQVLVTPDEADELRQGRMPQVLAFQQGGRSVPWYAHDGYDPYRDYWRYENAGWGGPGNGIVAGFIGAELLDGLLMPSYGMGSMGYAPYTSPYAYATDIPGYQGYADSGSGGFGGSDFNGGDGFNGGGDFLGSNDGSFDTQDFDPGAPGSGDFSGGDFSGGDFGGGDFGGGGDSGGGDF